MIAAPKLSTEQCPCQHASASKLTGFQVSGSASARFDQPGVYHLTLQPAAMETWGAVSVWGIAPAPLD
ncbi:MAG: hypothetical protein ACODAJ_15205 [Planctomycetota bacterium]